MHWLRRRPLLKRQRKCISTISFKIPKDLVANPGTNTSMLLFKLPPEILIHIFNETDSIADSISLAFSCKALLRIATLCELEVPNRVAHMARWAPIPPNEGEHLQHCTCVNMEFLLQRIRQRDSRGFPSRAWSVCIDCMRCLPTRKSYWSRMQNEIELAEWEKDDGRKWDNVVKHFSTGVRLQCPSCVVKEWNYREEFISRPRIEGPPPLPADQGQG
ncbi:hypothetical protein BGZ63DRAFT_391429 [Mariannaea sp. PMI_226]|nr:hypothetical protein BGZ63DRAFT_391429 [Mariannaea sp. PMI_226]